ncbi:MAG: hypothetical protein Q9160_007024 [Pyrenula sp. 1 TL-2023]
MLFPRIPLRASSKLAQLNAFKLSLRGATRFQSTGKDPKMSGSDKPSNFDADKGSVGKQFTAEGSVGSTAESVGGPFSSKGSVGQQFNPDGAVGGTAQSVADTAQGNKPGVFDKEGMVGSKFTAEGALGSAAQKVGGPFDKEGAVGKQFNADGGIGGFVQDKLGGGQGDKK